MLSVEWTGDGIRVVDTSRRTASITGELEPIEDGPALPQTVDEIAHARARRLVFPSGLTVVEELDRDATRELVSEPDPIQLPASAFWIRINLPVLTYLRFDGAATIRKPENHPVTVEFEEPTRVTFGFRSRAKRPREEVRVPRTVDGVATALSALSGSHRTSTPDRSFPTMREHPPTISFADDVDVPSSLRDTSDGVELVVPPKLSYLVTAASLVHYLGGSVTLESGATPTLITDERHELPEMPEFPAAAAKLLRRVFYLDCYVRSAGPHGFDLSEWSSINGIGIDPVRLYEQSIAERVASYLAAPYERIADVFPDWHVSMYVDPTFEHVRALPYVLYNVPQLFLPESTPLESEEWLSRSLNDFYRARRDSVSVDLLRPGLRSGRTHGWLAEGAPIDVFKAMASGYRNRERYRVLPSGDASIVAVVNEADMQPEASEAAAVYRARAADTDLDVECAVRENLSVSELAEVFEAGHDMVHFVGHCEPEGLVCSDGHLSTTDLEESNAETFLLNACGSYYEGVELIRKGSVAGGITFNSVLNDNAALVGTAFARLLAHGFAIDRAMELARRRVMVGKDYAVVGDGTHTLMQAEGLITAHLEIEQVGDEFRVIHDVYSPVKHGGRYQSFLQTDSKKQLYGNAREFVVDRGRLKEFLGNGVTPVVYDGNFTWSDELREEL